MCRSLDRDDSGRITISELQGALASLGVPVDAAVAGRMVDLIDVDGSSDISFQEFRRFAVLLPQSQVVLKTSESLLQHFLCAGSVLAAALSDLQIGLKASGVPGGHNLT